MPRRGIYLTEARAKAYIKAAGANPSKVLPWVSAHRVLGVFDRRVLWTYCLDGIEMRLRAIGIRAIPDPAPYMTPQQRSARLIYKNRTTDAYEKSEERRTRPYRRKQNGNGVSSSRFAV